MQNKPIGILDSGIGGLTVCKEIMRKLPNESVVYIGDSINVPYGSKNTDEIYKLAQNLIKFLLKKKVKIIIIACNTITVHCLDRLRNENPMIPIIGTVPVVKKAAELSKTKRIGILSTIQTASSAYQKHLIKKFSADCVVFNYGTDTLASLIDNGELQGKRVDSAVHRALIKFLDKKIDTLALGCTHFPYLKGHFQKILGPSVHIMDSGSAIARQVWRILNHNKLFSQTDKPSYAFYTTGAKDLMVRFVKQLLPEKKIVVQAITLKI